MNYSRAKRGEKQSSIMFRLVDIIVLFARCRFWSILLYGTTVRFQQTSVRFPKIQRSSVWGMRPVSKDPKDTGMFATNTDLDPFPQIQKIQPFLIGGLKRSNRF